MTICSSSGVREGVGTAVIVGVNIGRLVVLATEGISLVRLTRLK
jgi:hypothetical protein